MSGKDRPRTSSEILQAYADQARALPGWMRERTVTLMKEGYTVGEVRNELELDQMVIIHIIVEEYHNITKVIEDVSLTDL